ncbi:MAG: hypothetical protein AAB320_00590 [Elusimicrobiota bacterium]
MLTQDDLIDLIVAHLSRTVPPAAPPSEAKQAPEGAPPRASRGRLFLSEYDIKKRLTVQSEHLTIPKDAILSPLALDWLALRRIKIIRE